MYVILEVRDHQILNYNEALFLDIGIQPFIRDTCYFRNCTFTNEHPIKVSNNAESLSHQRCFIH